MPRTSTQTKETVSLGIEPGQLYILKLPSDFSLQAGWKITDVVKKPSFYRQENGNSEGLADAYSYTEKGTYYVSSTHLAPCMQALW